MNGLILALKSLDLSKQYARGVWKDPVSGTCCPLLTALNLTSYPPGHMRWLRHSLRHLDCSEDQQDAIFAALEAYDEGSYTVAGLVETLLRILEQGEKK